MWFGFSQDSDCSVWKRLEAGGQQSSKAGARQVYVHTSLEQPMQTKTAGERPQGRSPGRACGSQRAMAWVSCWGDGFQGLE